MKRLETSKTVSFRALVCTGQGKKLPLKEHSAGVLQGDEACQYLLQVCAEDAAAPDNRKCGQIQKDEGPFHDRILCVDSVLLKGKLAEKTGLPWSDALNRIARRIPTIIFSIHPPAEEDLAALIHSAAEGWIPASLLPMYVDEITSAVI